MKKSGFFAIVALVLCCLMLFGSCGDFLSDCFISDYKYSPVVTTSAKTNLVGTADDSNGDLILMKKGEAVSSPAYVKFTYTVYNLATGTSVFSVIAPDDKTEYEFELASINDIDYFTVETSVSGVVTSDVLYNAAGTAIASYTHDVEYDGSIENAFTFGKALYSYDENKDIVKVGDIDEFADVSGFINGLEYNYLYNTNGYTITDRLGNFISSFAFKRQYDDRKVFILENGNILVQYWDALPENEEKYDVYYNDEKYNIITEIYDVDKEKIKDVEVDFIILNLSSLADSNGIYNPDFDGNLAGIRFISDKRVETNVKYVVLDNDLDIDSSLDDLVKDAANMVLIADDRFIVRDIHGNNHFICDGDVYKTVTGNVNYNEKYIYTDIAIYNMDFEQVYDLAANNYEIVYTGNASFLLRKKLEDGYYTYAVFNNAGALVTVATDVKPDVGAGIAGLNNTATSAGDMYRVTYTRVADMTSVKYHEYYNETGTKITTFTSDIIPSVIKTARNGAILVSVYNAETASYDYYRFS